MIFLVACVFYDLYNEAVTGFTFGYLAALCYYIMRYNDLRHFYTEGPEEERKDNEE
tara:strand:- start:6350 stop:6517 length:168 start_codon:yes stop_codon:yes gene_type:complete